METKRSATVEKLRTPTLPPAARTAANQTPSVGTLIEQLLGRVHGLEVEMDHLSVRLREMEAAHFGEPSRLEAERGGADVTAEQVVVQKQYACIRKQDWEALASLYHPLVRYSDPDVDLTGREQAVERARQLEAPFSDVNLDVSLVSAGSGFAIAEWVYSAANHNALTLPAGVDLPATGKRVRLPGISVFQIEGDLVVAERSYWDNAALYSQLGVLPQVSLFGSW
jgi:predicted ester cyclase